jgi:hypothetical protein
MNWLDEATVSDEDAFQAKTVLMQISPGRKRIRDGTISAWR